MFTGIINHLGKIVRKSETIFTIAAETSLLQQLESGTSIAVNGTCLTVLEKPKGTNFSVEVMPETMKKTMMKTLAVNNIVNLELCVTPTTFLSGHVVQGHVDGVGTIQKIEDEGNSKVLYITIPENLNKYIVMKGSIAVNGISLTVIDTQKTFFTVGIIPFTWQHTMLHTIQIGDKVNIETDVLAKYVEKLLQAQNS